MALNSEDKFGIMIGGADGPASIATSPSSCYSSGLVLAADLNSDNHVGAQHDASCWLACTHKCVRTLCSLLSSSGVPSACRPSKARSSFRRRCDQRVHGQHQGGGAPGCGQRDIQGRHGIGQRRVVCPPPHAVGQHGRPSGDDLLPHTEGRSTHLAQPDIQPAYAKYLVNK